MFAVKLLFWLIAVTFLNFAEGNRISENPERHGHNNFHHVRHHPASKDYLQRLVLSGQLYGEKTELGKGLKYDRAVLSNENTTSDGQMSHCEYFDLHPFVTHRPYRQCLRTGYYELVSDMLVKTGSYGFAPHEGCNFLFYLWTISGSSLHNGLFVDAGANIGTCSLLFAANGVSGVAFEPMPANYKIFAKSILGNPGFEDMILLFPYGLGDADSSSVAYMQRNNMGNSMLGRSVPIRKRDEMVREMVNVKKMDDLLWANRASGAPPPTINLMKLGISTNSFTQSVFVSCSTPSFFSLPLTLCRCAGL